MMEYEPCPEGPLLLLVLEFLYPIAHSLYAVVA